MVKTHAQTVAAVDAGMRKKQREQAIYDRMRAEIEAYEDLRDDVISVLRNSGRSFEAIHGDFGPAPTTLERWAQKTVHKPQLGKMQSALRAVGKDIGIIDKRRR